MKNENKYPLNGLEKFILMHESEEVSYNSHIVIDFQGEIDVPHFYNVLLKAIEEIPLLRSRTFEGFWNFKRKILRRHTPSLDQLITVSKTPLTQDELDNFCNKKFNISKADNFRFMIAPNVFGGKKLIFSIHHSLCDAAGHFLLMEEIFRLMNGKDVRPVAKLNTAFKYRSMVLKLGLKWIFNFFLESKKKLKNQRKYLTATLVDNPTVKTRQVSSLTYHFSKSESEILKKNSKALGVSINEYLILKSFEVMDATLKSRSDFTSPIMAYVPKSLRSVNKIKYSFSNALSTVLLVGKRDQINPSSFLEKIQKSIASHKQETASQIAIQSLLPCVAGRSKDLKSFFKNLDQDPTSFTSSMLISAGKVSRSYELPENLSDIKISARGTMLKSPGIGILFTGNYQNESLTVEFIKDLTTQQTAMNFYESLVNAMIKDKHITMPVIEKNDSLYAN